MRYFSLKIHQNLSKLVSAAVSENILSQFRAARFNLDSFWLFLIFWQSNSFKKHQTPVNVKIDKLMKINKIKINQNRQFVFDLLRIFLTQHWSVLINADQNWGVQYLLRHFYDTLWYCTEVPSDWFTTSIYLASAFLPTGHGKYHKIS